MAKQRLTKTVLHRVADQLDPTPGRKAQFTCHLVAEQDPDMQCGWYSKLADKYAHLLAECGAPVASTDKADVPYISGGAFGEHLGYPIYSHQQVANWPEIAAFKFDFLNLLAESL